MLKLERSIRVAKNPKLHCDVQRLIRCLVNVKTYFTIFDFGTKLKWAIHKDDIWYKIL